MRKSICLGLLTLALTACGGSDNSTNVSDEFDPDQDDQTVSSDAIEDAITEGGGDLVLREDTSTTVVGGMSLKESQSLTVKGDLVIK
ncbi:hypothetical protein AAOGI_17140 [Agarivorans albus]